MATSSPTASGRRLSIWPNLIHVVPSSVSAPRKRSPVDAPSSSAGTTRCTIRSTGGMSAMAEPLAAQSANPWRARTRAISLNRFRWCNSTPLTSAMAPSSSLEGSARRSAHGRLSATASRIMAHAHGAPVRGASRQIAAATRADIWAPVAASTPREELRAQSMTCS